MAVQQQEDWAVEAAKAFAQNANSRGLKVPIDAVAEVFRSIEVGDFDLANIERVYSTEEAACFFGKSTAWLYWAMKPRDEGGGGLFYYPDGLAIEPERTGRKGIRRFSLDTIMDMTVSLYQRRTIGPDGLREIVKRIRLARLGRWEPDPESKPKAKRGPKSTGGDQ